MVIFDSPSTDGADSMTDAKNRLPLKMHFLVSEHLCMTAMIVMEKMMSMKSISAEYTRYLVKIETWVSICGPFAESPFSTD